jgi:putative two-component system response regulator
MREYPADNGCDLFQTSDICGHKSRLDLSNTIEVEPPTMASQLSKPTADSTGAAPAGDPSGLRAAGTILVVDDIEANARLLERLLIAEGYRVVFAHDGQQALERVRNEHPDLVLLDVVMPGIDGFETCRLLKADPETRLVPVVLVTALQSRRDRVRGLEVGADDFLSRPVSTAELSARVRSLLRIKRFTDELDSAESVILSLAMTIEARDSSTEGHCKRLADYAVAVGRAMGLLDDDLSALWRGGFLHDIGKIGIPDAILLKAARLTPEEAAVMREHPVIGDRLCGELRSLRRVRPIVRHHHERLDGTGYPDGLRGADIPLLAQVMSVVDVFDALTTSRPYKAAFSVERAFEELGREVDRGWRNPDVVATLLSLSRDGKLPVDTEPGGLARLRPTR